jgi:hypothetical protein
MFHANHRILGLWTTHVWYHLQLNFGVLTPRMVQIFTENRVPQDAVTFVLFQFWYLECHFQLTNTPERHEQFLHIYMDPKQWWKFIFLNFASMSSTQGITHSKDMNKFNVNFWQSTGHCVRISEQIEPRLRQAWRVGTSQKEGQDISRSQ